MGIYKASIYNYIFNSINAIIVIVNGIIMVPIYFHYISVSTYGAWLATGNVVAMLGLLESGFSSVITQKMAAAIGSKDSNRYAYLAGANIVTAVILSVAIVFLGLCITPFVTDWINVEDSVSSEIRISFVISLFASAIAICVSLFGVFPQVWQETKAVGMINVCTGLVSIASLVTFLLLGLGVVSIALSYLVRATLNLLIQGGWIINIWKKNNIPSPKYSITESKALAKDCVFPFFSKLSGVLMGNSQSFIIAHFMNPALSTVYDITSKVCTVACSFVSQMNGSFFALFSLTLSSGDRVKINNVFRNTSFFLIVSLSVVVLYSICFSEPVINYWVGLDKFGGIGLLIIVVLAKLVYQLRSFCNNILYTGGLINKSAILDIICAFAYVGVLVVLFIFLPQKYYLYVVPVAIFIVSALFLAWYLRLMNRYLSLNVWTMMVDLLKSMSVVLVFILIHMILAPDYHNLLFYIIYLCVFTIVYGLALYVTNKPFFSLIISKFRRRV